MSEDKENQVESRQLKMKDLDAVRGDGKEKSESKGGKEGKGNLWMVIILLGTALISIIFSMKSDNNWFKQVFGGRKDNEVEMVQKQKTIGKEEEEKESEVVKENKGWFGPAVYEFEKGE